MFKFVVRKRNNFKPKKNNIMTTLIELLDRLELLTDTAEFYWNICKFEIYFDLCEEIDEIEYRLKNEFNYILD